MLRLAREGPRLTSLDWLDTALAKRHVSLALALDLTFAPLIQSPQFRELEWRIEDKAVTSRGSSTRLAILFCEACALRARLRAVPRS